MAGLHIGHAGGQAIYNTDDQPDIFEVQVQRLGL